MKVVFVSNYLSPHQLPFSLEMVKKTHNKYSFISTSKMKEERVKLGYPDLDHEYNFVICAYEDDEKKNYSISKILDADVVIFGTAPWYYIQERIRRNKLVFKCAERQLKNGFELHKYVFRFLKWHYQFPNRKPIYLLCASAFTSYDYSRFSVFKNKAYKWGYYPKITRYPNIKELILSKKRYSLLWVGRFIDWKHPEYALLVCRFLIEKGFDVSLTMVGSGPMEEKLKKMAIEYSLEEHVRFIGSVPSDDVRRYMEESEIFLFTSNQKEGWGAVLNEAMNSACVTVAGSSIGAVPFLITNGENGFIFENEKIEDLFEKVLCAISDRQRNLIIGVNAYNTIKNEWNAEVATERFLKLTEMLQDRKDSKNVFPFRKGICSKAEIIQG